MAIYLFNKILHSPGECHQSSLFSGFIYLF